MDLQLIKPSFISPKGYKLWGNSRYLSYDYYLKNRFGCKVAKIPLNGGFTCPNRDGTVSNKGCLFCSESGAGDFVAKTDSIQEQLQKATNSDFEFTTRNKWSRVNKYIAYFQAFSSTYGTPEELVAKYNQALSSQINGEIVGLDIATRSDCINEQVLDVLSDFQSKTFLTVELGLQTIHETTRQQMNIGYDMDCFQSSYEKLKSRNIPVVLHLIFGLPSESTAEMEQTVKYVSDLSPFGVKFHQLMILKHSPLAQMNIPTLSQDHYADLVCKSIAMMTPQTTIARLMADTSAENLIAPLWSREKIATINLIGHKLKESNLYQGAFFRN